MPATSPITPTGQFRAVTIGQDGRNFGSSVIYSSVLVAAEIVSRDLERSRSLFATNVKPRSSFKLHTQQNELLRQNSNRTAKREVRVLGFVVFIGSVGGAALPKFSPILWHALDGWAKNPGDYRSNNQFKYGTGFSQLRPTISVQSQWPRACSLHVHPADSIIVWTKRYAICIRHQQSLLKQDPVQRAHIERSRRGPYCTGRPKRLRASQRWVRRILIAAGLTLGEGQRAVGFWSKPPTPGTGTSPGGWTTSCPSIPLNRGSQFLFKSSA